jgi:Flp pilus assembly pilin Flp
MLQSKLGRFLRDESASETMEWALVCGLVVIGGIIALTVIGPKITEMWNDTSNAVQKTNSQGT